MDSSLNSEENPYFLHQNDNPNTVVINPPLTGINYITWSRAFTLAISIRNKTGFLDGSIPTPDLGDALYRPWLRCNNLVLTWLLNSVSREIASSVLYINSAKEVWNTLKSRYSQPDNVRIYQLQQLLSSMSQGNLSVTEYFTALNAIWEEMCSYRPTPYCSCGNYTCLALRSVVEVQLADYAFKFLMGLGDSYEGIKGQILLMTPIPSLDRIFSMVLQEERQREARIITQPAAENSVLAATSFNVKRKFINNVICEHCAKPGHTKVECYRIIGFPETFKFTKNKHVESGGFTQRRNQATVTQGNTSYSNNVQMIQGGRATPNQENQVVYVQGNPIDNKKLGFTQEQLQRLIQHLNQENCSNFPPPENANHSEKSDNEAHFSNLAEIGSFYKDDDWTL